MKTIISTNKAPSAIGPYNQATTYENLVFTSGQIPLVPSTMEIIEGGIKEQSRLVLEHLKTVLEEAGSSLDNVVKTTCYLANIDDFVQFNEVYSEFFDNENAPSRATVAVKTLPKNVLVEVDAIAFKK
ncbi:RidA family protein [Poseidonibacter lekithochrous]|uniref:RidA family protein n=1 Tax=Poseidonibacter lekithochrous TaxID=1904463 RepID=UPI0008FC56DF|nr:RidA family protein [Poseidonibacter lekithochrous]QKJ24128.1 reactive intermediate/imine deaminase [Poseidonibacter lekithochrous]